MDVAVYSYIHWGFCGVLSFCGAYFDALCTLSKSYTYRPSAYYIGYCGCWLYYMLMYSVRSTRSVRNGKRYGCTCAVGYSNQKLLLLNMLFYTHLTSYPGPKTKNRAARKPQNRYGTIDPRATQGLKPHIAGDAKASPAWNKNHSCVLCDKFVVFTF